MTETGFGNNDMSEYEAMANAEKVWGTAGVAHKQIYYPGMCKYLGGGKEACDKSLQDIGIKLAASGKFASMNTKAPSMGVEAGGSFTGTASLIPPFVDPTVVDRTVRATPLLRLLTRRASRSLQYVYNLISAKAGAAFLGADAPLADQVDTRSNATVAMKYLYAVGRVLGPAQAGAASFINLFAEDLRVKTASMNETLENEIINGNTSTNANGFQGLIQLVSTNTTDSSGAEIELQDVRDDINDSFEANGLIDLVVTDGRTYGYMKGLLMDYQKNIEKPSGTMDFGIPDAFVFDGVLWIKDRYMPTTAASRRVIYLDTRYVFLSVLMDYTYQELAKVNDSDKYYIKWYGSLVVNFEAACVMRYGLA